MIQRERFQYFLKLGGFSSLIMCLVFLISCDEDFEVRTEYIYHNSLDQTVIIDEFGFLIAGPIEPYKSDTFIKPVPVSDKSYRPENFTPPIIEGVIFYGDHLCDTLDRGEVIGTGESILNSRNYEITQLGKDNFRFEYTFTEDDLVKADTCR